MDIRRQLEGGIETLETAHARYALLEKALRGRRWQQKTLRRLDTLRVLVCQEPRIVEALARLHQRARSEEWPDTEPALGLARKVERLRSRLEALPRKHFNGPAYWKPHLVEGLAFIDQRLTQTIAAPVSEEEQVLHQGAVLPMFELPRLLLVLGVFAGIQFIGFSIISDGFLHGGFQSSGFPLRMVLIMMSMHMLGWYGLLNISHLLRLQAHRVFLGGKPLSWRPPRWSEPIGRHLFAVYIRHQLRLPVRMRWVEGHNQLVLRDDAEAERFAARVSQWPARKVWSIPVKLFAMLLCLPELLYLELHGRFSGRYWLTEKRLVWRPPWRAPIHIPLQAIRPGGVRRLSRRKVKVRLVDGRQFRLGPLDEEDADRLVTLLSQHCPEWG
ncbi:hypothetical protein ATI61_119169 [Archangium gephyra]|uniref:Uncharacterized protein n=1 Tax=Archangium gephyra TaxID=48 RepID=A0AAC8Q9Y0_9BACT|nr:hypothetical protein [Archangium gephyra]AKJ03581.1 Hypothetical protein AA314_05207 [Archangium gephyra]REG22637.1 hypothetical protein ATI61_119169 [Archangium gephyra]